MKDKIFERIMGSDDVAAREKCVRNLFSGYGFSEECLDSKVDGLGKEAILLRSLDVESIKSLKNRVIQGEKVEEILRDLGGAGEFRNILKRLQTNEY